MWGSKCERTREFDHMAHPHKVFEDRKKCWASQLMHDIKPTRCVSVCAVHFSMFIPRLWWLGCCFTAVLALGLSTKKFPDLYEASVVELQAGLDAGDFTSVDLIKVEETPLTKR
jgi:hypothetical protein